MQKRNLVIYMPVLHRGYLEFLEKQKDKVSHIYIIDEKLQEELLEFKPDIAAINTASTIKILRAIGFENISSLSLDNIGELEGKEIILINDEVSRNLREKHLLAENVEWASIFLRWDKSLIVAELPLENIASSLDAFDVQMMKEAYGEAKNSGDWWRQVGAVIVKNGNVVARACNQGVPSDYTPYQVGMVRDFFKAGERQELSNTTHAEPRIIGESAKKGMGLEGSSLYVTHFPCAVCAKFIAFSGIKKVYFREGASTLDGRAILESAGIKIIRVPMEI